MDRRFKLSSTIKFTTMDTMLIHVQNHSMCVLILYVASIANPDHGLWGANQDSPSQFVNIIVHAVWFKQHALCACAYLAGDLNHLGLLDSDNLVFHHGLGSLHGTRDSLVHLAGHFDFAVLHHSLWHLVKFKHERHESSCAAYPNVYILAWRRMKSMCVVVQVHHSVSMHSGFILKYMVATSTSTHFYRSCMHAWNDPDKTFRVVGSITYM